MYFFFFLVLLLGHTGSVQVLLLTWHSKLLLWVHGGPYEVKGMKPDLVASKAQVLNAILSLRFHAADLFSAKPARSEVTAL